MTVGIYILCGGQSSRMGQCKANVELAPKQKLTMLDCLLQTLHPLGFPIHLVGKTTQRESIERPNCTWVSDISPLQHPLTGVSTALEHARSANQDSLLILPCDTPFLSQQDIRALLVHCPSVAIDSDGQLHPLLLHIPTQWHQKVARHLDNRDSMKAVASTAFSVRLSHDAVRNINRPSDIPQAF